MKEVLYNDYDYNSDDYGLAELDFDVMLNHLEEVTKVNRIDKVCVVGDLGLWNGIHNICPKTFNSVSDAIRECCEDYNEIYVEDNELKVEAIHHDGTNYFTIKQYVHEDGYDAYGNYIEYEEVYSFFEKIDYKKIDLKYFIINSVNRELNDDTGRHYWYKYNDNYVCIDTLSKEDNCYPIEVVLTNKIDYCGYHFGDLLTSSVLYPCDVKSNGDVVNFVNSFLDNI